LALPSVDTIEEKPGLSPSAGRLARVAIKAKQSNVGLALGSSYNDRRHLEKFQELSGIPFVQVQTGLTVDALSQTTNTFESMIEAIVGKIATTKQRSVP
jgi:zinc/manganese transport system substrate-binding protein